MQTTINSTQSRAARRELSLSQADVASALGLNRAYLSEFENGNYSRLTKSQTKKLRDFYTAKAEEARANGDDIELDLSAHEEAAEVPEVRTFTADGLMFRAAESVPKEVLASTREAIRQNDARLKALLLTKFATHDSFFGQGDLTEETEEAMKEAWSLLAANYLLVRSVTGWPEIGLTADGMGLTGDTIMARMVEQVRESFVTAGLITEELEEEGEE